MTERSYTIRLTPHPKHYVYIHFHPQYPEDLRHVVYVGQGCGARAWSRNRRNKDHAMLLRDWQFLGFHPGTYTKIVDSKLTKAEARKREANLIEFFRNKSKRRPSAVWTKWG